MEKVDMDAYTKLSVQEVMKKEAKLFDEFFKEKGYSPKGLRGAILLGNALSKERILQAKEGDRSYVYTEDFVRFLENYLEFYRGVAVRTEAWVEANPESAGPSKEFSNETLAENILDLAGWKSDKVH